MRIPIVNEEDEIIEYKERDDRRSEDIIRVTTVWVTNEKGDILLARRGFNKQHHAGLWGPAVAGTVEEDETYESNAIKEAEEEIGLIGVALKTEHKISYTQTHNCFVQCYSAAIDSAYPLVKQDDEVEEIRWFTKEELVRFTEDHPELLIPSFVRSLDHFLPNENKN